MKYMTFKGSHVYTCLAIMLEDFKIDKTDQDIALEMRMPYLFSRNEISKTKVAYIAGTRLQSKPWFDLFLNHYNLEYIEEYLTRLQSLTMLQNLTKFKRKALLSLHIKGKQHAVVFSHFDRFSDIYYFIMPEPVETPAYSYLTLDEKTLLSYLTSHVHIGFINPTKEKHGSLVEAIKASLDALKDYQEYVVSWCQKKHTNHRQIEGFDMVFRALVVDVRRMLKLKGEDELHQIMNKLSHKYINFLKLKDERYIIPMADEFKYVIEQYRAFVNDYYKKIEHTLKY